MICYFDTSALLKKYVREEGTDVVLSLFRDKSMVAATSAVTAVEGFHVICRQCREEKISPGMLARLLNRFRRDLGQFRTIGYGAPIIRAAQKIIRTHVLKTLDSIHLASALTIKRQGRLKMSFVSCDDRQNEAAQGYGFNIINPLRAL